MLKYVERKTLKITPSGRSSDYITPSFIFGCGFECAYCYCKRHVNDDVSIATNTTQILDQINSHAYFADVEKPNQTHPEFVTYDIGCNSDIALHLKHLKWELIFDFFVQHPVAMGTFATKYVNPFLLKYNPNKKIRIRFSLMPQELSSILEPKTSLIKDRLLAINDFIKAGYDVHVNFSPVVITDNWEKMYRELFELMDKSVEESHKHLVKAEVIFLTHNENKHLYNLENNIPGEDLLWIPHLQEQKVSQTGGKNLRYKREFKHNLIRKWLKIHQEVIPWNQVRYVF